MSLSEVRPIVQYPSNEELYDARRVRDLLVGAVALLLPSSTPANINIEAARGVILEAQASAADLVNGMEQRVAMQAEAERNANAGAAKSVGGVL